MMCAKALGVVGVTCAVLGANGCSSTQASKAGSCAEVELLVAASDYTSSVVCGAPGCVEDARSTGVDLGRDPQLVTSNDRAFFLARDNDLIFEIDPSCGVPINRTSVHSLAPRAADGATRPANPHDAAVAPDGTLVVALFGVPNLVFLKDGSIEAKLDLSAFDGDGNPQADAVRIVDVGGAAKAFVTLERLDDADGLRAKQPSQMLRVDVATRTVEAAIDLEGKNPFNAMSELDGALFIAAPGDFSRADDELAGVERFDTKTSTSRLLVRESALGGSVAEVAVARGCGAAIVAGADAANPTSLVTFDPESGVVLSESPILGPTPGYDLQGLAWRGDTLYVGDRRRGPSGYAVHVLERTDVCTLRDSGREISLSQQPVALRPAKVTR